RFSRFFKISIANSLHRVVDIRHISIDTVKFGDFIKSIPVPTSLNIFRMEPLRGFALLVVEGKIAFFFVDTFLGGSGKGSAKIEGREFTQIEQRLIKRVVLDALINIEKAWKDVHPVTISFIRSEVNPQLATIVPITDVVVIILFEVEIENIITGTMTICIPYSTIKPIITKLTNRQIDFQGDQLEVSNRWLSHIRKRLGSTEIEIVVELGSIRLATRDLIKLSVGDVIQLGNDVTNELVIKVEGVPKFKGFPGVSGENNAVQISSIIS
ncbi:MAG: flagellar motor switch protein FliM, partial [Nitrospinae bacterium]|nr:flagellar motor switch protein FliM [Nitrospinota bacterium]